MFVKLSLARCNDNPNTNTNTEKRKSKYETNLTTTRASKPSEQGGTGET